MFKSLFSVAFLVALTGCATTASTRIAGEKTVQDRFGNAIISPLNDLNIVQTNIPPVIQDALKNPYQIPKDISCTALVEQIQKLDAPLGTDLDALVLRKEKTMQEKGQEFFENEAIGGMERTINGAIPFRNWIRKFSGAERHSKDLTAAIAAGVVRRAFLKGLGQAQGCKPPAAPVKASPATVPVETAGIPKLTTPETEAASVKVHTATAPLSAEHPGTTTASSTVP